MAGATLRLTAQILLIDSTDKDVVFETTLFYGAVWKSHLAISMLDTLLPLSLVDGAICPEHFSIPLSLIVKVVTLVDITALPIEDTIAVFAVLLVLTIILVAWCDIGLLFPFAFAVLEALFEVSYVHTS